MGDTPETLHNITGLKIGYCKKLMKDSTVIPRTLLYAISIHRRLTERTQPKPTPESEDFDKFIEGLDIIYEEKEVITDYINRLKEDIRYSNDITIKE